MKTSAEILGIVNDYIEHLPYDRKPYSLYEPVRYVLSLGGKRIRPVLMMLSYELFADDSTSIIDAAVALETYHNYTLLHDDLMDNAPMRRGKATVHTRWNANTAILSGDTMLVMAYERMAKCKPEMLKPVIDLFTETALQIGEGQQYDMEFETRDDVVEAEYIEMIRLKTSVLLACATKMGALLAGAWVRCWPVPRSSRPDSSTVSANFWAWPSSCRTTISTCMATPRCSERPSEATYCATRRPICS